MSMIPLSGIASALGLGFQGYGQDQATLIQRQRQQVLDQQAAQKFGQDRQIGDANLQDIGAQADQRKAQAAAVQMKTMANQRAYNALKATQPDHPLAALPYDDTTDYTGELKSTQAAGVKQKQAQAVNLAGYNAFKSAYPTDPAVAQPFDPNSPLNFAEMFKDKRQQASLESIAARAANQKDHFTFPVGVGDDGKPIIYRGNTSTGDLAPSTIGAKPSGAGGAAAGAQQARLLAAVSEARLADERMRAYEDKLLGGQTSISPLQQAAGSLTSNLADSHGVIGALTQAGSEYALNKGTPDYAQYLRDASTIGRAEQMMSPRGGNETMVRANALLSRAGTGAMANTINASRMARRALFGQAGGVAQALSPQQNEKLNQGVERIKQGGSGTASTHPPLSDLDRQKAADDPQFAAWLKAQGITP